MEGLWLTELLLRVTFRTLHCKIVMLSPFDVFHRQNYPYPKTKSSKDKIMLIPQNVTQ